MRFFLDTETSGWNGEVISLALVREDGESLYLIDSHLIEALRGRDVLGDTISPWVVENVLPILRSVPDYVTVHDFHKDVWPEWIGDFLYGDASSPAQVFADFPLDIAALLGLMMVNDRETIQMPQQTHYTCLRRIRVYPTDLGGCVRHNAWWDAMALRRWMENNES